MNLDSAGVSRTFFDAARQFRLDTCISNVSVAFSLDTCISRVSSHLSVDTCIFSVVLLVLSVTVVPYRSALRRRAAYPLIGSGPRSTGRLHELVSHVGRVSA